MLSHSGSMGRENWHEKQRGHRHDAWDAFFRGGAALMFIGVWGIVTLLFLAYLIRAPRDSSWIYFALASGTMATLATIGLPLAVIGAWGTVNSVIRGRAITALDEAEHEREERLAQAHLAVQMANIADDVDVTRSVSERGVEVTAVHRSSGRTVIAVGRNAVEAQRKALHDLVNFIQEDGTQPVPVYQGAFADGRQAGLRAHRATPARTRGGDLRARHGDLRPDGLARGRADRSGGQRDDRAQGVGSGEVQGHPA